MALICKFWHLTPTLNLLQNWIFLEWEGAKKIFYLDQGKGFFIAIFSTKENRNVVFRNKAWVLEGLGLHMQSWSPKFSLQSSVIRYILFWVQLPSLPMEY